MPEQNKMTEEEVKDLQKRVEGFNEEVIPLLKKYEVGLGASAFLLPDGRVAARPQLFNDRKPVEAQATPPAEEKKAEGEIESSAV